MDSKDKWNQICELHFKFYNSSEQIVQNIWENICSEILGYSRLENEIDSHRSIRIGSTDRIIPDIIIKNTQNDLFIIELKQNTIILNKVIKYQIYSYLKQLKNNLGILICDKILLINYNYNKNDEDQETFEIKFEKDNIDGIKFVDMFSKNSFNRETIQNYIHEKNRKNSNIKLIEKEITTELINTLLSKYFSGKYSTEEYKEAVKNYDISVSKKIEKEQIDIELQNITNNYSTRVNIVNYSNKITKLEALKICRNNNIIINGNITFASENNSYGQKFWANPSVDYLRQDWWLILNDISRKLLQVFFIPANSIAKNSVCLRNDKPNLIDLQIGYDDRTFIDTRSKISLDKWHKKTISINKA
jgi:hypothetical protein